MKLPTPHGPKTSLDDRKDIVAADFGPKTKRHVVLFANATQIELVSVIPYRKKGRCEQVIDVRQRLSMKATQAFLFSLFEVLDYEIEGVHSRTPHGHLVTRRIDRQIGFRRRQGKIRLHVPAWGLSHSADVDVPVTVTRARQLARALADLMGWDLE